MKNQIKNNPILVFFYRLLKIIYYRIIYNSFLYKIIYPHNINLVLENQKKYTLVVCHNGGGGTITYLNNKYGNQKDLIILRNTISADKDYLYSIENNETHIRTYFKPSQISKLSEYLKEIKIVAVESYMSIDSLFKWMSSLDLYISYDLHDFHCIWINAHLCNKDGYLSEEQIKHAYLKYITTKITYNSWHKSWENFFPFVNDIYAFSESSKALFVKHFPAFEKKVKVTPHSLEYIKYDEIKKLPQKFKISIFGSIKNIDKGCETVKNFLQFSADKDYEISINGILREDCCINAENIHYMGPYDASNIRQILIDQKISVVFFPSVWPETFSYLISELIAAGIPIACFNLGAQAEKVSKYKYGEIIKENTNEEIFSALKKAYEKGQCKEDNNE